MGFPDHPPKDVLEGSNEFSSKSKEKAESKFQAALRPLLSGKRQTLPKTTINQRSTEDPRNRRGPNHTPLSVDQCTQKLGMQCLGPQAGSPKMPPTTYNASSKKAIHDKNPTELVITSLGGSEAPQKPHKR